MLSTEVLSRPQGGLTVLTGHLQADNRLHETVEECLLSSSYRNQFRDVRVSVTDRRTVIVNGTVRSYYLKSLVSETIKRAATGIRICVKDLVVVYE